MGIGILHDRAQRTDSRGVICNRRWRRADRESEIQGVTDGGRASKAVFVSVTDKPAVLYGLRTARERKIGFGETANQVTTLLLVDAIMYR